MKAGEKAKSLPPTKCNLLSILASLFDPLEIISPVIVCAKKLFFQEVCKAKIEWDEEFTGETCKTCEIWKNELVKASQISIASCLDNTTLEKVFD